VANLSGCRSKRPVSHIVTARAVTNYFEAMKDHPAFAVPLLEGDGLNITQTANILLYLGEKHGFTPQDAAGRLFVRQLRVTIADVVVEAAQRPPSGRCEPLLRGPERKGEARRESVS
jgi:glutathione S-transferase